MPFAASMCTSQAEHKDLDRKTQWLRGPCQVSWDGDGCVSGQSMGEDVYEQDIYTRHIHTHNTYQCLLCIYNMYIYIYVRTYF